MIRRLTLKSLEDRFFKKLTKRCIAYVQNIVYVDGDDLQLEYNHQAEIALRTMGEITKNPLTKADFELKAAILDKAERVEDAPSASEWLQKQMCRVFGCKYLKPQRLISLSYEEEEKRALETWSYHDFMLWVACFAPLEVLDKFAST